MSASLGLVLLALVTAICTVLLSVVLHGLSANPWAAHLGRKMCGTSSAARRPDQG